MGEIRKGDRVELPIAIVGDRSSDHDLHRWWVDFSVGGGAWVTPQALLAGKRLPREVAVGDRVTATPPVSNSRCTKIHGEVVAILGEVAWVTTNLPGDWPMTIALADLTPADDTAQEVG